MHRFAVWAPIPKKVAVKVRDKAYPMEGPDEFGYWHLTVDDAGPGDDYGFLLDDDEMVYPDPRSMYQPEGVHKPSRIYDQNAFHWHDSLWQGPPLTGAIIYEMHIGTFTPDGTFDSAIQKLDHLVDLGITHVEIMPVAEFPGGRGWGYDGVDLYAVNHCYGGPDGLKRFVDACHSNGIAVILDVVYNHFGPTGNYTGKFGPYTTEKHSTPWGQAINFEDRGSHGVRRFFIENALMWMRDYHIDGLRLDAIHEIIDRSAVHFLEQLSADVDNLSATLGRRLVLIAESDLNNPCIVRAIEANGYGMDAQWSDDFHHSLTTILFTEPSTQGYYDDFGDMAALAKALRDVFVYDGQFSKFRDREHGRPVDSLSAHRFVSFLQNHDQVGNRAYGDRIHENIGLERTRVGLGLVMLAPMIPMLFQGEEFASSSPFLYFADHNDPEMAKLVAEGRKREFAGFGFDSEDIPNPEDQETFVNSKLNWDEAHRGEHGDMLKYVKSLIRCRRRSPSLNDWDRGHVKVTFSEKDRWLRMDRKLVTVVANMGKKPVDLDVREDHRLVLTSGEGVELRGACLKVPGNTLAMVSAEDDMDLRSV